jgi:peptide deformylase
MLEVLKYGNKKLNDKSVDIDKFDEELIRLADDMYNTMIENHGIGLAAPQVGILKKLIVIDTKEDEGKNGSRLNLVNPKIVAYSARTIDMEEGCLSVPGVYAKVTRPISVKIEAQDLEGKEFTMKARGLLARVIQHEIDHLKGVLFVEKVDNDLFKTLEPDLVLIKQGKIPEPPQKGKNVERIEI